MKRTATLIKQAEDGRQWVPVKQITCEVAGEMSDGSKVWSDVDTGEQYFLTRFLGKYMFFHI